MKYYNICILTAALLLTFGCDNILKEDPASNVTSDNFYSNADELELALNGVYSELWAPGLYRDAEFPFIFGGLSGETLEGYKTSSENSEVDKFTATKGFGTFDELWQHSYEGINRANEILESLPDAEASDNVKKNISGQTKFLRALYYFYLVRSFGGVPLYEKPTKNRDEAFKSRSSVDEIYDLIISDLQDAEEEFGSYSQSDQDEGKATLGSAKALLAKVYLQRKNWDMAATKAEEVMDMGVYDLFDDYADIYRQNKKNGKEHIFSVQYLDDQGGSSLSGNHLPDIPDETLPDGTGATFSLNVDMQTPQYKIEDQFFDDWPDTYRKWRSARDTMPFYYDQSTGELVEDDAALPKPTSVKFYDIDKGSGELNTGTNYPVIRYADVLLIYAEAENEINNGPTPEAYEAINKVRRRARAVGTDDEQPESVLPDLSGLSYEQFSSAVLDERGWEFTMEGQRRWDLLRFGKLIEVNRANGKNNVSERDTLFPIPGFEMSKNDKLEQNPNWD